MSAYSYGILRRNKSVCGRVWENGDSEAVKIRNTCLRGVADRENELFDYVANSFILSYQPSVKMRRAFATRSAVGDGTPSRV